MASNAKKKTTMAKLARESRLRERRLAKQAKKDARKQAPPDRPEWPAEALDAPVALDATVDESAPPGATEPLETAG
jgi:hypothetical protein